MSLKLKVFISNVLVFCGTMVAFAYSIGSYLQSDVFKKNGFYFFDLLLDQKYLFISLGLGVVFLSYVFYKLAVGSFGGIVHKLKVISENGSEEADLIANASRRVSSSSSGQASAIQETVATLAEISAMVNRSVDYVKKSNAKAEDSNDKVLEGKQAVDQMIEAMHDISSSNNQIITQVNDSNAQIQGLVEVIREISAKTNVINDIVFQTKLLSFNASVEAARAGEHGKGFAVVAEEVGNLAHMSGNAAQEIEEMLRASIQKVESVVSSSSETVTRLSETGNSKIESGMGIASRCGEVLDEVVENVAEVNKMMSEVLASAEEQAGGINAISEAMSELDTETHGNSNAAHESSAYTAKFGAQVKDLQYVVEELESLVGSSYKVRNHFETEKHHDEDIEGVISASFEEGTMADVIPIESTHAENSTIQAEPVMEKASGDSESIPDHSDPRFEDF